MDDMAELLRRYRIRCPECEAVNSLVYRVTSIVTHKVLLAAPHCNHEHGTVHLHGDLEDGVTSGPTHWLICVVCGAEKEWDEEMSERFIERIPDSER